MRAVTEHVAVMDTYKRWPVEFVSGEGAILHSADGRRFVDLLAGIAVASIGHAHPAVAAAVADQAARLVHVSNLYWTAPQLELAARLGELTGGMKAFFCNSGAEAIECALKLARKWGRVSRGQGVTTIAAAEGGFHGRTYGALSATGQPGKKIAFAPVVPGIEHVPFGDIDALANRLSAGDVAAVLLEPIQGEAGVVVPPAGYLGAVRELCDRFGTLLIIDEVRTGLGRTGAWFAFQHEGITPDVITLAKALGAGLPIGACLASPDIAATFEPGDHATTFGGGPVITRAALATLDVIATEGLVARSASLGTHAIQRLRAELPENVEVRGRGLMIGIDFKRPVARAVTDHLFDLGFLVNDATLNVVRLTPPLVIAESDLDSGLDALKGVIDAL